MTWMRPLGTTRGTPYEASGPSAGSMSTRGDHVFPWSVLIVATKCCPPWPSWPAPVVSTQVHEPSAFTTTYG